MNPEQIPPTPLPNGPLPRLGDSPTPTLTPPRPAQSSEKKASMGFHMLAMLAYLLVAGVFIFVGLDEASIFVFWVGAGIHTLVLFVSAIANALRRRWRDAGTYALCLIAVPLLSCGYCLGGLGILDL